jgi:hypothetical protein
MPALLLVGLGVPMFFDIFDPWQERGHLPALTSFVLATAKSSQVLFHVPVVAFLIGLVASDVALAGLVQRQLWPAAICFSGITAAVLVVIGLLQPIIQMTPTV